MKKQALSLIGIALILGGCSYSKEHPPTEHNKTCEELNQKLTFSTPEENGGIDYSSPTKQADLYREYKKYNCNTKQ
jgi:hypothetical protein